MGFVAFAEAASAAGVDALILVNMPPEEAADLRAALAPHDIAIVFLLAPTTTEARARAIVAQGAGFLYYVSLKGITGASHIDTADVAAQVARLRQDASLPLVIGFGIKSPAVAQALAPVADGVVIGSALVELLAATPLGAQAEVVEQWAHGFRTAIDA
jgi:tryptophan synthase alpha chain